MWKILYSDSYIYGSLQHPYVYGVLVFEAMATFVGQISVLSLIAIFGAATTAMVSILCVYIYMYVLQMDLYVSGADNNSKKGSDIVTVILDFHKAIDRTTLFWINTNQYGNYNENVA